jgi:hypothetical protein
MDGDRLAGTARLTAATAPQQPPGNCYLNAQNIYNLSENTGHLGPNRAACARAECLE